MEAPTTGPTTLGDLLALPGWSPYYKGAQWDMPDGATLTIEGRIVAILDSQGNDVSRVEHPTLAHTFRAALQVADAFTLRL
jgi:hypothetical protein